MSKTPLFDATGVLAPELRSAHHHDGMTLCDAMRLWMTPDTPGGGRSIPPGTTLTGTTPDGRKVTVGLENQARLWMTPTARDHKDGATSLANTPVNGLLGRQVLTTPPGGDKTSGTRRSLNPLFVEALMGWPSGWTGFGSVATAWCHWLRRMRCELWRLSCSPMDEAMTAVAHHVADRSVAGRSKDW